MKPFLLVLLVVAFATPSWAEPLRLNLSRSQTLNLPQPPAQRDSLVNGIVIGAIVGALWCGFVCAQGVEDRDQMPFTILAGAGMGGLLGGAIDAYYVRRPGVIVRVRF